MKRINGYSNSVEVMDSLTYKKIQYLILFGNEKINLERLKLSVNYTINQLSVLSSKLVRSKEKQFWDETGENIWHEIKVESQDEEFNEVAYEKFLSMQEKNINLDNEPPFKVIIISSDNTKRKLIVFGLHQMVADAIGLLQIVKYIGDYYSNKNETRKLKVFNEHFKLLQAIGLDYGKTAVEKMRPPSTMVKKQPLITEEKRTLDLFNVSSGRVSLKLEEIERIKEKLNRKDVQVNDLIVYWIFLILEQYNLQLQNPNKGIPVSLNINLRKYLADDKEVIKIGNISSIQDVFMRTEGGVKLDTVINELKRIRQEPMGVGLYYLRVMIGMLPYYMLNRRIGAFIRRIGKRNYFGIPINNIEDISRYLEGFKMCIEDLEFIPDINTSGLPLANVLIYNDTLKINFAKANDEDNIVEDVLAKFKDIIERYK